MRPLLGEREGEHARPNSPNVAQLDHRICPVIESTGLVGRFDIHLEFSRDRGDARNCVEVISDVLDQTRPTVSDIIQEQLGSKLVPSKGPVEMLSSITSKGRLGELKSFNLP